MRIRPGGAIALHNESITGKMLMERGYKNPDFIPTIMRIPELGSRLISILDIKGLKTKGLNYNTNFFDGGNYRTVGSNCVEYRIEASDMRLEHFKANPDGVTFVDDATPSQPGLNGKPFYFYTDSNYLGYHEVILLADGKTQIWSLSDTGKEMSNGSYEYLGKIVGGNENEYVDPVLLSEGYEFMVAMSLHEQEFSTRGNEIRIPFAGVGRTWLSLQRIKYSYSGTAQAMDKNGKTKGYLVDHFAGGKTQTTFLSMAEMEMLKTAARFTEFQILEGKTTVTQDTNRVLLTNENGREVLAGSGIMHANDGAIEIPINDWTEGFMDALLSDVDPLITRGSDGNREVVMLLAPRSYHSFTRLMTRFGKTADSNIEETGGAKGIVDTYSFYEFAGIRLIAERYDAFSRRPGILLKDGTRTNEWDGIIIPIGQTNGGRNGVELVQLRPAVRGTVAGINEGGQVASSVDGTHNDMLWQIGVISQIQPIKLFKPYKMFTF